MSEVRYRKVDGSVEKSTWPSVLEAAQRVERFFAALPSKFVEREDLLRKIKYAFLMREHVLLTGPTGAAKSKLIDTIFESIEGGVMWSMDLTKFTSDTHLFGNYDMVEMQKTGKLVHLLDGSIATANFAKTGEFFDASDATLRTLLGVLNERVVKRGPQVMRIPLVTALADTNFEPNDLPQRSKALEAVVDRFLFRTKIAYVQDPANRYRMLETALENDYRCGLPPLDFSDIELVSGVVVEMNLLLDPYIKQAYSVMTDAFSKGRVTQNRAPLSDRRFVRSAHLMEVCALLNGRTEVTFDDLKISRHVLCQCEEDEKLLASCREASIEKWSTQAKRRSVDLEAAAINAITARAPVLGDKMTIGMLKDAAATFSELLAELGKQKPESIEAQSNLSLAIASLSEGMALCDDKRLDLLLKNVPKIDPAAPPPHDQVGALLAQIARVHDEARQVRPTIDRTAKKQVEVFSAVFKAKADIETSLVK